MWIGWVLCAVATAAAIWCGTRYRRVTQEYRELQAKRDENDRRPAVLSHEIRTPLSLVRGAAELLTEETPGPLNATQRMFVDTITDNTQVVIDMAEDFLLESRMNQGSLVVNAAPVDVRTIVADTAREVRRIMGTRIAVEASGGILPIVSDERLIRQMVWNLVNNAARHAGDDSVITVVVREKTTGGCLISVIDEGGGLAPQDLETIFTPFVTGSSRRPGSGLGMMIVKRIAQTLGGRIFIDTERGHGTAVVIDLPDRAPVAHPHSEK